jgi:hypothetical protein
MHDISSNISSTYGFTHFQCHTAYPSADPWKAAYAFTIAHPQLNGGAQWTANNVIEFENLGTGVALTTVSQLKMKILKVYIGVPASTPVTDFCTGYATASLGATNDTSAAWLTKWASWHSPLNWIGPVGTTAPVVGWTAIQANKARPQGFTMFSYVAAYPTADAFKACCVFNYQHSGLMGTNGVMGAQGQLLNEFYFTTTTTTTAAPNVQTSKSCNYVKQGMMVMCAWVMASLVRSQ